VLRFLLANVTAVALLIGGSLYASYVVARSEALADASTTTCLLASAWIEPELSDGVLTGDPAALARLDLVVEDHLRQAKAVRIKIWDADSRIVYSDEARLIGHRFALQDAALSILDDDGASAAEISDLSEPENVYEEEGRLVEVYAQVATPSGQPLLVELYFPYDHVTRREAAIWGNIAPISASALVLMLLIQLPLVPRMVRQIRQGDRERLVLHARAADASTEERRRITADLHDGVVQDLAGSTLLMSGVLERLRARPDEDPQMAGDLAAATAAVRQAGDSLRSLLVDVYPPHRARAGLPAALAELAARLQEQGVHTTLEVPQDLQAPQRTAELIFRVAQEAVNNIGRHAQARSAHIRVHRDGPVITMEIRDDGAGFDLDTAQPDGHFGMHVLADLTANAGGTLDLASAPGHGTFVRLEVPAEPRHRNPLGGS
jgi:signal transduction histidine kinase